MFRRRQRNAPRAGQPSIGFAEGLRDLDAYEGTFLTLGHLDDRPRGGYYFQLFLTPDRSRLVACFGVGPVPRRKTEGSPEDLLDRHRSWEQEPETTSTVDREYLLALLSPLYPAEIPLSAVAALEAGAPCQIETPVETVRMRSSFVRWESLSRKAGREWVTHAHGIRELEAYEDLFGAFGHIDDRPRGGYYFQLFLAGISPGSSRHSA
ncbi:hypothetical protein VSH64_48015 [Amycolatopsis rhabdoformis]|uniref:Uncharacterized protein n=1 Tax=Amycolatopsis rhabdoformis TaxID=1448059 RepID=A0ABZ1I7Z4_9PSEU|nr:hypothetical protein [Amycolatopsis rhabdoformis]WSE30455.1 hypothetical protein VSH64_48015 [Amycolatopsis rhabdoformis]